MQGPQPGGAIGGELLGGVRFSTKPHVCTTTMRWRGDGSPAGCPRRNTGIGRDQGEFAGVKLPCKRSISVEHTRLRIQPLHQRPWTPIQPGLAAAIIRGPHFTSPGKLWNAYGPGNFVRIDELPIGQALWLSLTHCRTTENRKVITLCSFNKGGVSMFALSSPAFAPNASTLHRHEEKLKKADGTSREKMYMLK
ncbi:hypothetical protein EJ04DRAFT_218715 [Polyplosphaeria fusca]|uniref:Uncharacterized protein n=1 Tax=Polyplosphaeria fusca TaxID=682080 RepID=A0A9P4R2B7_9PLEO|nr:hypothetical protein EJ04DRAFT_218715 [Polyplosphaeria fusca]